MSTFDRVNELSARRNSIEMGGGEAAQKKLHTDGKLSARERIQKLLDENSFVEIGAFVRHRNTEFNMLEKETPADGAVTGYGTVEGRLVYVYSQDPTVLGGSVGEMHAKKITNLYDQAMKMGAPVVGILDSVGLRLQEGTDGLEGYGALFLKQTLASGVIPQISVVLGDCAGGASFTPALSDFVFMTTKHAKLFMSSPNTISGLEGKMATFEQIGSAKIHSETSGLIHFTYDQEEQCLDGVRELLSFLPSNNMEDAPLGGVADDLNRIDTGLNTIVPEEVQTPFDMKTIILSIIDQKQFFEVQELYAKSLITGFARLNGYTVGVVANQSLESDGLIDRNAADKGAAFINVCDAYNIPIVTLTDVGGYKASVQEEQQGIIKQAGKLLYAFANATVPKINLLIRKGFGSSYVLMNSKHIGADIVFAWPSAQIAVMNPEAAVNVMYANELKESANPEGLKFEKRQEYEELQASPYHAASRGFVDDIIEPAATRKRVIAALEMLASKRETRPAKKHSSVTL